MTSNFFNAVLFAAGISAASICHAQATYQFSDLGSGYAAGINDAGQIVGTSALGATLWNGTVPVGLSGGEYAYATAINNAGQIVGATDPHGLPWAVSWSGTAITSLASPGGGFTYANGINNAGQIVGGSSASAVVWGGTDPINLGFSSGYSNAANGINNSGEVVGNSYSYATGYSVATAWHGSTVTVLNSLGGNYSDAYAVNDAGEAVGTSNNAAGATFATLWKGPNVTVLNSLGGTQSYALAINNAGEAVGSSTNLAGTAFATLWDGTTAINLNNLLNPAVTQAGWVLTVATGINNNGWIIGDAVNVKLGESDAFLLSVSPVPEPGAFAMLLAGLCMIASLAYFKPALFRRAGEIEARPSAAFG